MDEAATPAGRALAAGSPVARRLQALARTVPPLEIAELWVFPPLAELESSAEFFLFTRFHGEERRVLCSARLQRENGSDARQVVVEHGSVPADRVPRLVRRLQRRLGEDGQPFHALIEGSIARWKALFEEARGAAVEVVAGLPANGGEASRADAGASEADAGASGAEGRASGADGRADGARRARGNGAPA